MPLKFVKDKDITNEEIVRVGIRKVLLEKAPRFSKNGRMIEAFLPSINASSAQLKQMVESCMRDVMETAEKGGRTSVAFPVITLPSGVLSRRDVFNTQVRAIVDSDQMEEMTVFIALKERGDEAIRASLADLSELLEKNFPKKIFGNAAPRARKSARAIFMEECDCAAPVGMMPIEKSSSLQHVIEHLDESFSEMLLRKIDEKGMTDAQCYKKANIDRKLFSKIRGDKHYRPSKNTAIAFAVSLELPLAETEELLLKAGYALSPSSKFDVIVKFFIDRSEYDIFKINEALFAFDQTLLGA